MSRNTGRIKWFDNRRGFGFLTDVDSNEDVFIHFSSINVDEKIYKTLIEGEYVEFDLDHDDNAKSIAKNITGIRNGPLLCQNTERRVYSVRKDSQQDSERRQRNNHRGNPRRVNKETSESRVLSN